MIPLADDNPSTIRPLVTFALIGLCTLVYLLQTSLGPASGVALSYGLIPAVLFGQAQLPDQLYAIPAAATLFSSMFLHGSLLHFLGNMLFLWIFGDNVEDSMGHGKYIVFYLACGIVAAFAQAIPDPDSTIPMIGASGALAGVLGAYLMLYPHARILVALPLGFFVYPVRLRAVWVLGLWFAVQLVSELSAEPGSAGIAFRAHLGGFVAGAALIPLFKSADIPLFHRPNTP